MGGAYEIIGDILDAIVIIFLYDVLMGKNYKVKKCFVLLIYIIVMVSFNCIFDKFNNSFINIFAWQIVSFCLTFLYKSKLYEKVIASVGFNIIGIASEMIVVSIFSFIGDERLSGQYFYVKVMISKLIDFVFIVIISLIYKKKNCLKDKRFKYIFLISILVSIIEMVGISYLMIDMTGQYLPQIGVVSIAVVILNFILYIFVDNYSDMFEHKEREQMLEKSVKIQEDIFAQMSDSYMQLRRMLHDTNKHMKAIAGMIEEGNSMQALEYIDATLGEVNCTYKKVNTGNVVIDVMLSNLINQCDNFNIKCETEVVIDSNALNIDNRDMSIMLGNLTENAVNYVKKISDNSCLIDVAVIMDNSNFIIDIENTCFDTEAMLKRDCGIENIEKIVTKYSGSYSIKVDKEKYKATIILPLSTDISAIQY